MCSAITTTSRARAGQLDTVRFYKARFTRLYPIYLLSLLLAWRMVPLEYGAHTHAMFWAGMVLSPLLLQGWIPSIATFLNTPAWTMSAESFYYVLFPWMARWKKPTSIARHLWKLGGVWMLGLIPGTLYIVFNPDGIAHPDRWSWGPWLQALKYTPLPASRQLRLRRSACGVGRAHAAPGPPALRPRHLRFCRRLHAAFLQRIWCPTPCSTTAC